MKESIYLTFDAEPFWCTLPVRHSRDDWTTYTDHSVKNTDLFLNFCMERGLKPTIFFVGRYAQLNPQLVRRAVELDCRIGSHSMWHDDLNLLSQNEFLEDAKLSKAVLEDISGKEVIRFRAPSFSISHDKINLLQEAGYSIDSSVSTASRLYGGKNTGEICINEFQLTGWKCFGKELTVLGGGYFRLMPTLFLRLARQLDFGNMIYLHPHDISFNDYYFTNMSKTHKFLRRLKFGNTLGKLDTLSQLYNLEGF